MFADDEETKELEVRLCLPLRFTLIFIIGFQERLKREYRNANKTQEGYIDADEEEDEDDLTGAGKAIRKLMRKTDKDGVYDSDDERNPYASSVSRTPT